MDITRDLHNAENILRDYIDVVLTNRYGSNWYKEAGIPLRKKNDWEVLRIPIETDSQAVKGKEKLIQYAHFNDIRKILEDNWIPDFERTFGDFPVMDSYLKIMAEYRNPSSRRRELFIYQKHLILGISGEIRNKITIARSLAETGKEIFPRIESAKDNLGGLWVPGKPKDVKSSLVIKSGDMLEFIVTAYDPLEGDLEYSVFGKKWQSSNVLLFNASELLPGKDRVVHVTIRSKRKHHAFPHGYDDRISFTYNVIPPG